MPLRGPAWPGWERTQEGDPACLGESPERTCSFTVPSKKLGPQPSGRKKKTTCRKLWNSVFLLQVGLQGAPCPLHRGNRQKWPQVQGAKVLTKQFAFFTGETSTAMSDTESKQSRGAAKHFWGRGSFLQLCGPRLLPVCCLPGRP